ncbi:MAG TPA: amidohydrolase family protein [Gemmatimonadales bacterium]|nr:amidohydrolase family protein [Gemmatimonadales bacterium]
MRARRLAARWLIPIEGPPLEHGALLIGAGGRIEAVGRDQDIPRPSDIPAADYGDAVILPGLINTHTHLELTGFEGRPTNRDFPSWIRELRELKATRTAADYLEAARRGLADCYALGVTTIADTGDSGATIQALAEADGSGVAYQEVFGPHPGQLDESLTGLRAQVSRLCRWATHRIRIGVSPHAPYTVSGPLLAAVAEWSRAEELPLATHVAESPAEVSLLAAGTGPFADAWRARGIPLPQSRGQTPVEWLAEHGALTERTLCIHAVQVDATDIDRLAGSGAAVAHCPLSNRAHAHGAAPLGALLEAGVRVGLGTDSVVSIGRLDMMAEAQAAQSLAPLTADQLLELATLSGARALGFDTETGSLRIGKWGDCTVIRARGGYRTESAAEKVLRSSPADVLLTYVGGREVYRAL